MRPSSPSLTSLDNSSALAAAKQRIRELTEALDRAHQAEQQVESLNRLRDENPNPIVRIGANLQQQFANAAARRLGLGMARAEQVHTQRQLRTGVQAALAQGAEHREVVIVGARIFDVCIVPFEQGSYANLYFSDVTEREAARQQLREHQEFMQQVLDTIPTVVFVRDTEQKLVFQNQAMLNLVEASPFAKPVPPTPESLAEVARYAAIDTQVRATGQEMAREESFTLADDSTSWFYTVKRPLRRSDGSVHVLGVSTDITDLKRAQQTLERSEKQYRDLMHYGQALIGTCDMQGTVLSVNPALAKLLREAPAAMPGMSVTAHMLPEDRDAFADYLTRIAASGEEEGVLRVVPRGTEELRYLLYHNFVVREPGQAPYIVSHAHDITERVLAGKEMKRAKLAAEAAVQARENFLANMSHEIRTPMNGVLGVANLLAKTPLTPEQQEYLRIIRSSGQHLLAVLNDVLDMAKITSGKLELSIASFNLCDSMQQAVQPLALQAQEKGIAFEGTPLRVSCPYPVVQGDAHRLNQILINLVSNAIKFTPTGGRVKVEGELLSETADTLTIQFRVTDTGMGMQPDVIARIFESFTQAYADTTRLFGGTGLGLSISRALVEQMNGSLTVESTPGQGSCFAFTLPLPKATLADATMATDVLDTGALHGVRVLLVEDNDINRMVASWTMQAWGVVVTEAESGPEGLEQFEQQEFDLVLMDIQMPGMSGLEAVALIRAHPEPARAHLPVLALTANAFRTDHLRYLAAGMDDCLAKPFEEAELYAKLVQLLTR
ncbi:ATP-binding protein [Hymenobacter antarcticus]